MLEGVQKHLRVKITIPRDKEANPAFLKIVILLSNKEGGFSAQEVENRAALLLKWLTALIDSRVLKRFGELLLGYLERQK